jgi:serine/threonine protein kinase
MVESFSNLPDGSKVLLGNYHLLYTLGSGVTSKVKLAKKMDTGVMCAVKIHAKPSQNDVESLSKEIEILQNIPHKNLINLLDFQEQGMIQKKDAGGLKDHKQVYFVVVLELAEGGEMIQHLLQGGALNESQARYYFK